MNENAENGGMSLREAIEAGFNRVSAEEATENAEPGQEALDQTEVETQTKEAPSEQENNVDQMELDYPTQTVEAPQNTQQTANNEALAAALQMIRELRAENARMNQMVQEQGTAMKQQSHMAENAIEQVVTEPEIPQLDFNALSYMGDEERNAAVLAWQNALMQNAVAMARAEFAPVKAEYEAKSKEAAENAARNAIFGDPRFADFEANKDEISRIAKSHVFDNVSPEQKYLYSGLIARGMKNDPNAKPTTEQIVQMVMSNPDALKAIETRRAQEIRDKNANLPVFTASSGLGNANPVPENRVKTREELESRISKRLGL